jgi:hypothetical protein
MTGAGEPKLELTEDDLEVAEASLSFAIQNCPVEGVLPSLEGTPVTYDELQSLLDELRQVEDKSSTSELGEEALLQLRVVIGYTSENCPVENVATFHDGRSISGRDIIALAQKLRGSNQE